MTLLLQKHYTQRAKVVNFTKPIILLADAATASEAEIFLNSGLLHM
ncbi:hypothetical protein [Owenweeksia hongkongensis]